MASYEVRVVERAAPHTLIGTIANAAPTRIAHEMVNLGPGSAAFVAGVKDPDLIAFLPKSQLGQREVQIWRDGSCHWWGVPVAGTLQGGDQVEIQCLGLWWYLMRRHFGPVMVNWLTNGSFENGLVGWTPTGCTAEAIQWNPALGAWVARLVGTAGADGYLRQQVTVTTNPGEPLSFTLAGHYRIDPATWTGPALDEKGLWLSDGTTTEWEPITEGDERGVLRRQEAKVQIPGGATSTLDCRLTATGGGIDWDAISLTVAESVPAIGPNEVMDIANIAGQIVDYAQNGQGGIFGNGGKSPLSIGFASAPTGIEVERHYYMHDHANIGATLVELTKLGCDLWINHDAAGTSRWLEAQPRRGVDNPTVNGQPIVLDIGLLGRLVNLGYRVDVADVTTSHRVLGSGDGSDREIGWALNAAGMGGLVLETVDSAPPDTPISGLQALAESDLVRAGKPIVRPTFTATAAAGDLVPVLKVGDKIPSLIDHGWVQMSESFRVVRLELTPGEETLAVGVNEG